MNGDRRGHDSRGRCCEPAAPISAKEVKEVLNKWLIKKAADSQGVVVEMLQQGGERLIDQIARLFTDVLDP